MASVDGESKQLLREVSRDLLEILIEGESTEEKRRQAEDWLRSLSDKHPDLGIEEGLHRYYMAEAGRLRKKFTEAEDLLEKLDLGRSIDGFLEKAREAAATSSADETGAGGEEE